MFQGNVINEEFKLRMVSEECESSEQHEIDIIPDDAVTLASN